MTIEINPQVPQTFSISLAGPQGPAGASGVDGVNGSNGTNGTNGTNGVDGATWLSGTTTPNPNVGKVTDFYLNTSNGDIYEKTAPTTWTLRLNITPAGNFLAISSNLSDVDNIAISRTNLGLGNAATKNVGVLQNNVANGEHVGLDTGVVFGGELNANGTNPIALDISPVVGYIVDYITNPSNPTVTRISTSLQTVELEDTVSPLTWWSIDSTGAVIQQTTHPTNTQRRTHLQLGATAVSNGQIFIDQSLPVIIPQPTNQLYDLMYAIGAFNISGNELAPAGTNLQLQKASGTVFEPVFNHFAGPTLTNDPHVSTTEAQSPVSIRYATSVGAAPAGLVTSIDPTKSDVGGVATTITGGAGRSTIQYVYLFPVNNAVDQVVIQYGQTIYNSLSDARAAIGTDPFVQNPNLVDGILIGFVVVTRTATDLSNTSQARIVKAGRFGEGAVASGQTTVDLLAANNLSDLTNVPDARTNLGLGTAAVLDAEDVTGTKIYQTDGQPNNAVGIDGDYAIDNATGRFYGPKEAGEWATWSQIPTTTETGWFFNGFAELQAGDVYLTRAGDGFGGGSAWFGIAQPTTDLDVTFDVEMSGGTGADGITFAFADAGTANTFVGGGGGDLGLVGVNSVAVAFTTAPDEKAKIVTTTAGAMTTVVESGVLDLRPAQFTARVRYDGAILTCWINDVQIFNQTISIPTTAKIGFTAANGGSDDNHIVRNVLFAANGGMMLQGQKGDPGAGVLVLDFAEAVPSGTPAGTVILRRPA